MFSVLSLMYIADEIRDRKDIKHIYIVNDSFGQPFSAHFMSTRDLEVGYAIISRGCESKTSFYDREWGEANIFKADKYDFNNIMKHL